MVAFDLIFPEAGVEDYRLLVIGEGQALPPERYLMQEFYCADRDCDCRRVTVRLISESNPEFAAAFISYGWETPTFYRKWSKGPGYHWKECAALLWRSCRIRDRMHPSCCAFSSISSAVTRR